MRTFDTGATRSPLADKPQYEGYLHPLVIKRFGEYMLKHQTQADGQRRAADNWQKGIPPDSLMDSAWRHLLDVWLHHRGHPEEAAEPLEEALCAVMFNMMALLLHSLTAQRTPTLAEHEEAAGMVLEPQFMKHVACSRVPCKFYQTNLNEPPCRTCRDHSRFQE